MSPLSTGSAIPRLGGSDTRSVWGTHIPSLYILYLLRSQLELLTVSQPSDKMVTRTANQEEPREDAETVGWQPPTATLGTSEEPSGACPRTAHDLQVRLEQGSRTAAQVGHRKYLLKAGCLMKSGNRTSHWFIQ